MKVIDESIKENDQPYRTTKHLKGQPTKVLENDTPIDDEKVDACHQRILPSDSNTVRIQNIRSKFEKTDFFLSFSQERNGLIDQEKECSKVQQLERKINMIQPEITFWSERNMKSSQILHTTNIRSHKITGNSSDSKKSREIFSSFTNRKPTSFATEKQR